MREGRVCERREGCMRVVRGYERGGEGVREEGRVCQRGEGA